MSRVRSIKCALASVALATLGTGHAARGQDAVVTCDYKIDYTRPVQSWDEQKAARERLCLQRLSSFVTRVGDLLKIRLDSGDDIVLTLQEDTWVGRYLPTQRALLIDTWSSHHWGTNIVDLRDGSELGVYLPPTVSPDGRWGFSRGSEGGVETKEAFRIIDFQAKPFRVVLTSPWEVNGANLEATRAAWDDISTIGFYRDDEDNVDSPTQRTAEAVLQDGKWLVRSVMHTR